jgi:endonuclease YncB( thermonuclease family)
MRKLAGVLLALGVLAGCSHTSDDVTAVKVVRVIDGDTIELENGQKVRLIGIDTPERGCPGYQEAKKNMQDLVLAKRIILVTDGKQDTDRYGRLLRYVDLGDKDVGEEQIKDNLADARYDSEEKNAAGKSLYPKHSRQDKYHKEDKEKNPECQSK